MVARALTRSVSRKLSTSSKPVVPSMLVGTNIAWINTWAGAWVFSNLMYHAEPAERIVGTTAFTYDQGKITTASPTDIFRVKLADSKQRLPAGTYTVLNPSGAKVAIGTWTSPFAGQYTTATEFTFVLGSTNDALSLFVEGSLNNNNGNLAVILPGHRDKWLAGDIFNSAFIDFHKGLKTPIARLMDWNIASKNFETNWEDRSLPTAIGFRTPASTGGCVPYEVMCEFAKRIKTDIWICVPYRATEAYVTALANLLKARMPSTQKVWIEYGNEIWNNASPWGEGTTWVSYLKHTRRTATANPGTQNYTLANHGLSNGTVLRSFSTKENAIAKAVVNWRLDTGGQAYVKVIDVNTFELYDSAALTTNIALPATMVNLLFVVESEAGKTANMNQYYSEQCLRNWDIFDAILGQNRYKRVLSGQSANVSVATGRLAVAGIRERASVVSIAPYYDGAWFGCRLSYNSGQIVPNLWASDSGTFEIAVYPNSATPTFDDVKNGVGVVSKVTAAYTAGPSTYTNATAITGLVDGTTYKVFVIYTENGNETIVDTTVTVSSTPGTAMALRTYDQQLMANRIDALENSQAVTSHIAVAGSIPVVAYEGGIHYHQSKPTEITTWFTGYQESPQFGEMMHRYLGQLASVNCASLCYYGDSLGTTFSIADNFNDITDVSYVALKSYGGKVPFKTLPTFNDLVGDQILTQPTFPHPVRTFPDVTMQYSIISGNRRGNFEVVGNVLRMKNDVGVNWGAPRSELLTLLASDGKASKKFTVAISLGNAWYEGDALFAWSSVDDDDSTQINPVIGGTLPVVEGAAATLADDMFGLTASGRYGSATALTATIAANKPILWAFVLDKASHTAAYKYIVRQGSGNFMAAFVSANVNTEFRAYGNVSTVSNPTLKFSPSTPVGKHVFWAYFDPVTVKLHAGVDQVENGSVDVNYTSSTTFGRELYVGGASVAGMHSSMKHGSIQVLNRSGMTLADAKAIVAKMQAHHGIA